MKKILKINSLFVTACFLITGMALCAMQEPAKKAVIDYKELALEVIKEIGQRDDVTEELLEHTINQLFVKTYVFGPKSQPHLPTGAEVDSSVKRELNGLISQKKVTVSKSFIIAIYGPLIKSVVADVPTQNVPPQNVPLQRWQNESGKGIATSSSSYTLDKKHKPAKIDYKGLALEVVKEIGRREDVTEELLGNTINQIYVKEYAFGPKSQLHLPTGAEADSNVKRELADLISQDKVKVSKAFRRAVFAHLIGAAKNKLTGWRRASFLKADKTGVLQVEKHVAPIGWALNVKADKAALVNELELIQLIMQAGIQISQVQVNSRDLGTNEITTSTYTWEQYLKKLRDLKGIASKVFGVEIDRYIPPVSSTSSSSSSSFH